MHEMVIAESMLEKISAEAKKQNARPASAKISCGTLNTVNDEVLRFAFESIAKDTLCEGLTLEIEHKPLLAFCRNCNKNFEIELSNPACTYCNCGDFTLNPDAPLVLEEIVFQTE